MLNKLFARKPAEPEQCLCGWPAAYNEVFQYDGEIAHIITCSARKQTDLNCAFNVPRAHSFAGKSAAVRKWNTQIKRLAADPDTIRKLYLKIQRHARELKHLAAKGLD